MVLECRKVHDPRVLELLCEPHAMFKPCAVRECDLVWLVIVLDPEIVPLATKNARANPVLASSMTPAFFEYPLNVLQQVLIILRGRLKDDDASVDTPDLLA